MIRFSSPVFGFFAFYFIFILGEYCYRFFSKTLYVYGDAIDFFLYDQFFSIVISFLFFLLFLFSGFFKSKSAVFPDNKDEFSSYFSNVKVKMYLIFLICFFIFLGLKSNVIFFENPLAFRQIIQNGGNAYFLILFMFLYKIYGVVFFERVFFKKSTLSDWVCLFFIIVFCLFSGFTSLFIHFFIAGFLYLNVFKGVRIIRISVILLFMSLIVSTPFYTIIRESLKNPGIIDYSNILSIYIDRLSNGFLGVLYSRFDYFDNLVWGSKAAREHQDFFKIFNFFSQPIPRFIFPDKPYNYSTIMTSYVYPENISNGVTANFGFINEFVLYFGDFGWLLSTIIFLFLLVFTYKKYSDARGCSYLSSKYVIIYWTYFMSFPIGYFNDMGLPTLILNLLFWYFFVSKVRR